MNENQLMHLKLLRTKLDSALRAWEEIVPSFPSRAVAYGWCADIAEVIENIEGWIELAAEEDKE